MAEKRAVDDLVHAGWVALGAGDWKRDRAGFDEALKSGETLKALEGLGWAAYCLDDDGLMFDARERAFRLYRRRKRLALSTSPG